ncbi:MAG: MFS transporter [Myxococcota bacterium]
MNEPERLPTRALIGYGLAAAPVMYAYMLILIMYMKYAVDDLGASPAAIGSIFFLAKMWDAVSDPMVGNLSDRTMSSRGRRRPWILAGAPLIALFGVMAWSPPATFEGGALIAWITVAILGFYTAHTIFEVPHMSLGAELSLDAQERNRIFGARQLMKTLGMLVAGILGTWIVSQGVAPTTTMAWVVGGATLLMVFAGTSLLPPEREEFRGRGGQNPIKAIRDVIGNRHARLFLLVIFIDAIGAGGIGVLIPFVMEYVVGDPELTIGGRELAPSDLVPFLLGIAFITALISIPIWLRLARHFEKRRLVLISIVMAMVGYGSAIFVGPGDWEIIAVASLFSGAANACANTLGYTLKSEIIDSDELETGERKEGAYFAGWSFMNKLGGAIMVGSVGLALQASGFIPNDPDQSDFVKTTMIALMGGVPLVCYGIGALAFSRYQLSEKEHRKIRAALDARATE